jgi:opacity protein-like surface antigen
MNIPGKILAILGLALASLSVAQADAVNYARVSVAHFEPEANGIDGATGALLSFGLELEGQYGETASQFELEFGYAQWDYTDSAVIGGVLYTGSADLKALPVLLTYRYQWRLGDRLKLGFGPSAGFTHLRASGSLSDGVTTFSLSDTDWAFTYGAGALLSYQATDNIALSAGYRYLLSEDAKFSAGGGSVELTDLDTHVFEIGLSIAWPF